MTDEPPTWGELAEDPVVIAGALALLMVVAGPVVTAVSWIAGNLVAIAVAAIVVLIGWLLLEAAMYVRTKRESV